MSDRSNPDPQAFLQNAWADFALSADPGAKTLLLFTEAPEADPSAAERYLEEGERLPEDPLRLREWTEGRRLRAEIREKLGETCRVSVSHSRGRVAVLGCVSDSIRGVGVDLEHSGRELSGSLAARIGYPWDGEGHLSPIELWTAKEASYKANRRSVGTQVSAYHVQAFDPLLGRGELRWEEHRFPFQLRSVEGWILAMALERK